MTPVEAPGGFVLDADAHGELGLAVESWSMATGQVQELRRLIRFGAGALIESWEGQAARTAITQLERLAGQVEAMGPLLELACSATTTVAARIADARAEVARLNAALVAARERRDSELRIADGLADGSPLAGAVPAAVRRRDAETVFGATEAELTRRFHAVRGEVETAVERWARDLAEATPRPGTATAGGEGGAAGLLAGLVETAHRLRAQAAVEQAATLAERIRAAGSEATPADLAGLRELLDTWADDPAFATGFLREVGPQGLLDLTSGLVVAYHGSHRPGRTPIDAEAVGALQRLLGRTLATGSHHLGEGPGQLPETWLAGLLAAGRRHGRFLDSSSEVYGYQWLGVLLGTGSYGREFLLTVGRDMLAVEREVLAGRDAALRALPSGLPWGGPATLPPVYPRLDFTGGTGGDTPLGYDPVRNLMVALARDPETARQFLATDMWQGQAPILDYLVTDRVWTLDESLLGRDPGGAVPNEGLLALGETLRVATTVDADDRSWQLVRALVQAVYDDEQAQGFLNGGAGGLRAGVFGQVEIVPPELRDALSRITVAYLPAFHNAFDIGARPLFDAAPLVPGAQASGTEQLDVGPARLFLAELGRDPVSYERISSAAVVSLRDLYLQVGSRWTTDQMEEHLINPEVAVFAALDHGAMQQRWSDALVSDERLSASSEERHRMMGAVVTAVFDSVPGGELTNLPFSVAGEYAGSWTENHSPAADSMGVVNHQEDLFITEGARRVKDAVDRAEYEALPLERLDSVFVREGERIPMTQWTETEATAWTWFASPGGDPGVDVRVSAVGRAYEAALVAVEKHLNPREPR